MIEPDTIKLLRECDAGVKMGIASIEDVQGYVRSKGLQACLDRGRAGHQALDSELQGLLDQCRDGGKDPNPVAKGMSWVKANMKLGMAPSDRTAAGLITDGCNMGIKSLNRYLNQYQAADRRSRDIAHRLIGLEEQLARDVQPYL